MHKVSLSNKVFTENPLLDEIVYNARQLATGVIVKDPDQADLNETAESLKMGDILIACKNKTVNFHNFYYSVEDLKDAGVISTENLQKYADNNDLIPEYYVINNDIDPIKIPLRKTLLDKASKRFCENYVEENSYYRTLMGLPTERFNRLAHVANWQGLWIDPNKIDMMVPTSLEYITPFQTEGYIPIHELDLVYKNTLFENGTCENIINSSEWIESFDLTQKDVLYVMHIGDREVDPYYARTAEKFALLYCPPCDAGEVRSRFKDLYEANRLYLLYTAYSDAYKYASDYYHNFMIIFLIIQTIIDMIVELPEYIIRRDIFDTRTCKYIFESNGVKYFKDIPLKYQVTLVKNLNKLIKFKSTDKCIVDIISIFGAENIEVFRYYILRDRRVNDSKVLDYYSKSEVVVDTAGVSRVEEDNQNNYDIRFIKVPLLGNYDEEIRTDSKIYSYDSMIDGDATWNGDKSYKTVLEDIKDLDFTVLRSKFYSIEAVIDLAKRNFTLVYFMNILMYNDVDTSALQIPLPNVSNVSKFSLVDIIIALYSISYIYYGVEDTIIDTRNKASQILGFNPEADLATISSWLQENEFELDLQDGYLPDFIVPPLKINKSKKVSSKKRREILSFKQLEDLYLTNKNCFEHIRSILINPPSKKIYDIYKKLYDSLMITNKNMEYFIIDEDPTITEKRDAGYKVKFITFPDATRYNNYDHYLRDIQWLKDSINENELCFAIDKDFDTNHKYIAYIKEGNELKEIGKAMMAYTYKDFLKYKNPLLYAFIAEILGIPSVEDRRSACVNAIQSITSYMKDWVKFVDIDTVLAGLPSISLDFIKRYVEEVIDFFKSFKIFTHGSSITYVITDKFDNYVQVLDDILLNYLFDKSEIIKIEDAFGGPIKNIDGSLIHVGDGIHNTLTHKEKHEIIDKVWFDIYSFIQRNFKDFYNSDNYKEASMRIRDYIDRYDHYELNSKAFTDHYIEEIESSAVDAIISTISKLVSSSEFNYRESINAKQSNGFMDHYDYWISDIGRLLIHDTLTDKFRYQDDCLNTDIYKKKTMYNMPETINHSIDFSQKSKIDIVDGYYSIITQEFPPHTFDQ